MFLKINPKIIFLKNCQVIRHFIIMYSLLVSVPPEKLLILDDKGTIIPHHILGPYNEGSSVNITCIAIGGKSPACEIRLLSHESSVCPSCLTILLFRQLHMTYDIDRL